MKDLERSEQINIYNNSNISKSKEEVKGEKEEIVVDELLKEIENDISKKMREKKMVNNNINSKANVNDDSNDNSKKKTEKEERNAEGGDSKERVAGEGDFSKRREPFQSHGSNDGDVVDENERYSREEQEQPFQGEEFEIYQFLTPTSQAKSYFQNSLKKKLKLHLPPTTLSINEKMKNYEKEILWNSGMKPDDLLNVGTKGSAASVVMQSALPSGQGLEMSEPSETSRRNTPHVAGRRPAGIHSSALSASIRRIDFDASLPLCSLLADMTDPISHHNSLSFYLFFLVYYVFLFCAS
jgi:hypothetical protein